MEYELLSPAGDTECLEAALAFGADAVYIGGPFMQMRAAKAGFDMTSIASSVQKAHEANKKLYVAVNSLAKNSEIELISDYAESLGEVGVDALIVCDLGVLSQIKSNCPDMPVFISTQASCMNYAAARVFHDMGADRIILAREASLEDIAEIRAKTPKTLELEAFVHGSMCMAYSGRCLISSFLRARSGNRGLCAQPCRWKYHLYEENTPNEYFEVEESEGGSAILSSCDLNMISHIEEMKQAGITSFKIEGRMKTAYYVATVTSAYRRAIDGYDNLKKLEDELECVTHRPYSTGFYYGDAVHDTFNDGIYRTNADFVGRVLGWENGMLLVEQRNNFKLWDKLEILTPKGNGEEFTVKTIINPEGEKMEAAPHPKQIVRLACDVKALKGDFLRRRKT